MTFQPAVGGSQGCLPGNGGALSGGSRPITVRLPIRMFEVHARQALHLLLGDVELDTDIDSGVSALPARVGGVAAHPVGSEALLIGADCDIAGVRASHQGEGCAAP